MNMQNAQIQQMMKQAQELQKKMGAIQEEIANSEFTGEAGGSLVKVTVSGKGDPKKVEIDPSLLSEEEKEVLEDLIVAAIEDAKNKADSALSEKMNNAGISPELMKFGG